MSTSYFAGVEGAFDGLFGGLAVVTVFGGFVGAWYGMIAGSIVGLSLGLLDGALLFVLTLVLQGTVTRRYRRMAGVASSLGSFVALCGVGASHEPDPDAPLWALAVPTFDGSGPEVILFGVVPILVATVAMGLSGMLVAAWSRQTGAFVVAPR